MGYKLIIKSLHVSLQIYVRIYIYIYVFQLRQHFTFFTFAVWDISPLVYSVLLNLVHAILSIVSPGSKQFLLNQLFRAKNDLIINQHIFTNGELRYISRRIVHKIDPNFQQHINEELTFPFKFSCSTVQDFSL